MASSGEASIPAPNSPEPGHFFPWYPLHAVSSNTDDESNYADSPSGAVYRAVLLPIFMIPKSHRHKLDTVVLHDLLPSTSVHDIYTAWSAVTGFRSEDVSLMFGQRPQGMTRTIDEILRDNADQEKGKTLQVGVVITSPLVRKKPEALRDPRHTEGTEAMQNEDFWAVVQGLVLQWTNDQETAAATSQLFKKTWEARYTKAMTDRSGNRDQPTAMMSRHEPNGSGDGTGLDRQDFWYQLKGLILSRTKDYKLSTEATEMFMTAWKIQETVKREDIP